MFLPLPCYSRMYVEEEEGFYTLPDDKNGHVEALLVQQLNHRVHSSLPYSSSVLSDLQVCGGRQHE